MEATGHNDFSTDVAEEVAKRGDPSSWQVGKRTVRFAKNGATGTSSELEKTKCVGYLLSNAVAQTEVADQVFDLKATLFGVEAAPVEASIAFRAKDHCPVHVLVDALGGEKDCKGILLDVVSGFWSESRNS